MMYLGVLVLITALTISGVAIYYSIAGLVAIFAAAALPIMIMGGALEIGKLVTAVWLHKYWRQAVWWLKTYLTVAVVVLMFITSMGIFGFLSKAHIEQTSAGQESVAQVERIDGEITRLEDIIDRAEDTIKKLETTGTGNDVKIQNQIDAEQERIDKAYERIQPAINEQQAIINQQAELYKKELDKIDQDMATLQGYIDNGETKKAQQMIGASADGIFGKKTADKIGDWQEAKQAERADLIEKIKQARNNPQAQAAADEIKRLRAGVEEQIKQSNSLIDRLRKQLGNEDKAANIDADIDEQNLRIKNANAEIDKLFQEKYALEGEYRKLEAEVGPIKYIAEFIYGEEANRDMLEEAVRWVIIIIIFVFDPLAVLLLIASQYTFHWRRTGGSLPPKHNPDPEPDNTPPFTDEEWDEAHRDNYEYDRAKRIDENEPPSFEEPKQEAVLSKKKTDQYLLWPDIDPEPIEPEQFDEQEKYVDPNQLELDYQERFEDETEEDYVKRIWKKENPNLSIEYMKKAKDDGKIEQLPWEVDETINDMKSKGEWPDQASQESQEAVSEQLKQIDGLDAWNSWVEKANEEAEKNPENFEQNSEQNDTSIFNKINQARQNFDPAKIKELEITEEQYRDASQKHIISLIERLKKGLINVEDLTETEANNITKLLDKS